MCLCVKVVCERLMCDKLCEEAADEAETARGRDKEPKTRTPHKMGGTRQILNPLIKNMYGMRFYSTHFGCRDEPARSNCVTDIDVKTQMSNI